MLLEKLKALECSLHGVKRNDREWLEHILHPEFSEITQSGVLVNREEVIDSLVGEEGVPVILSSLHGVKRNDREWLEHILHPEFSEIT